MALFSIGELSKMTGLTIKALRLYDEKKILLPTRVEGASGYRYYDQQSVEVARAILHLRAMGLSLQEIRELLEEHDDQADILEFLESKKDALQERAQALKQSMSLIDQIISQEKEARVVMQQSEFEVEEKQLDAILIAGIRMKGRYDECGKAFSKIGRSMGRFLCGKPLALYYDGEYKEEGADFEPAMPIRKGKKVEGISVRELAGGKCYSLIHKGSYGTLGRSYEKLFYHLKEQKAKAHLPTREVYLKGPGMIFKGNPKNYLTEIQILVESP